MIVVTRLPKVAERSVNQSSEKAEQKVYWLSRHTLTDEQEQIIRLLYGDILVEHFNPYFLGYSDFIRCLQELSSDGFVYAVVPRYFIEPARRAGCQFGVFIMNRHLPPYPKLVEVRHYLPTKVQTVFRLPEVI